MENSGRSYTLDWVTVEGDAQPGVDPTDRDALMDLVGDDRTWVISLDAPADL